MAYVNVDQLLNDLPDDLPYKASVKRVLIQASEDISCDSCKHIARRYPYASMYPCNTCIRANSKDYYNVELGEGV